MKARVRRSKIHLITFPGEKKNEGEEIYEVIEIIRVITYFDAMLVSYGQVETLF